MKTSKYIMLVLLLVVFGMQSCAPTRQQVREANTNLAQYYTENEVDTVSSASISWKEFFDEPELSVLIDSALVNNQELNIFLQKVIVSKNEINARKGEYLPFVNYQAGTDVEKVGKFTRNGAVESNLLVKENEAFPDPLTNFSLGLNASWELDVWKKLRNSKKAAVMEYLSTIEGKNFMVTNLVAEIADAYYELVSVLTELALWYTKRASYNASDER